jgi:hypothetical protein
MVWTTADCFVASAIALALVLRLVGWALQRRARRRLLERESRKAAEQLQEETVAPGAREPGRCYINFICGGTACLQERVVDGKTHMLGTCQPVSFDAVEETWGSMLDFIREAGWRVEIDGARVVDARCAACVAAESA